MGNICKLNATGRIARDAEVRQVADTTLAKFRIGSSIYEKQGEHTNWIDCSLWGSRAEKLAGQLTKGKLVTVSGTMKVREFERKDGGKDHAVECRVEDIDFIWNKGAQAAPAQTESVYDEDIPF